MRGCATAIALMGLVACGERADDCATCVRVPLIEASVAATSAPPMAVPSMPMTWTYSPSTHGVWYGAQGAAAQLSVVCEGGERRAAKLRIVRYAPAERGAEAVFAIQSSEGVLRLPVSAVRSGDAGYVWRGVLDAADPRAQVLLGDSLKATVPGGGELVLPPMGDAGAVVSACLAAAVQTLPNRASNPARSPAAR